MLSTKVPQEFPRRARSLDFAVFKASEYRNLGLFFFPLVIECMEPDAKEICLWLNLGFMLRSAVIPTPEFCNIDLTIVQECCKEFYQLFENLFSAQNCTYNLHVFCCHLLEIRTHGPLTETSAFKFESFYGELRRSFVPGTCSPLKQILKNVFLKRNISKHYCKHNTFFTNYDTSLECNKLFYIYQNKKYAMYEISDIDGDIVHANKIGMYPATFPQAPNIPWSSVGVFRKGGVSSEITTINTSEIHGKVLNVGKYLITCSFNVLNEK